MGLAAEAQAVDFRVIAPDLRIVGRSSAENKAAILNLFLTEARPAVEDWIPPEGDNLVEVVVVELSPDPPARLIDELAACLKMAQIVHMRPSGLALSLTIRSLNDSDLAWSSGSMKVTIKVPDAATIACDTRK